MCYIFALVLDPTLDYAFVFTMLRFILLSFSMLFSDKLVLLSGYYVTIALLLEIGFALLIILQLLQKLVIQVIKYSISQIY